MKTLTMRTISASLFVALIAALIPSTVYAAHSITSVTPS